MQRVVAYVAVCPCGYRGRSWGSVASARLDAREHNLEHAGEA